MAPNSLTLWYHSAREIERKNVSEGDYTSLYWHESAAAENEYEDVEHMNEDDQKGASGIRGLKE